MIKLHNIITRTHPRALGITVPIIGTDTWETNEFITVGGSEVEGAVMSTFFNDSAPTRDIEKTFLAEYKKHILTDKILPHFLPLALTLTTWL